MVSGVAPVPFLTGPRLVVRLLAERDVSPLAGIGATPRVARW